MANENQNQSLAEKLEQLFTLMGNNDKEAKESIVKFNAAAAEQAKRLDAIEKSQKELAETLKTYSEGSAGRFERSPASGSRAVTFADYGL